MSGRPSDDPPDGGQPSKKKKKRAKTGWNERMKKKIAAGRELTVQQQLKLQEHDIKLAKRDIEQKEKEAAANQAGRQLAREQEPGKADEEAERTIGDEQPAQDEQATIAQSVAGDDQGHPMRQGFGAQLQMPPSTSTSTDVPMLDMPTPFELQSPAPYQASSGRLPIAEGIDAWRVSNEVARDELSIDQPGHHLPSPVMRGIEEYPATLQSPAQKPASGVASKVDDVGAERAASVADFMMMSFSDDADWHDTFGTPAHDTQSPRLELLASAALTPPSGSSSPRFTTGTGDPDDSDASDSDDTDDSDSDDFDSPKSAPKDVPLERPTRRSSSPMFDSTRVTGDWYEWNLIESSMRAIDNGPEYSVPQKQFARFVIKVIDHTRSEAQSQGKRDPTTATLPDLIDSGILRPVEILRLAPGAWLGDVYIQEQIDLAVSSSGQGCVQDYRMQGLFPVDQNGAHAHSRGLQSIREEMGHTGSIHGFDVVGKTRVVGLRNVRAAHWTVICIDKGRRTVCEYDSAGAGQLTTSAQTTFLDFADLVSELGKWGIARSEWTVSRRLIIRQTNGNDCGVCAWGTAEAFLHDRLTELPDVVATFIPDDSMRPFAVLGEAEQALAAHNWAFQQRWSKFKVLVDRLLGVEPPEVALEAAKPKEVPKFERVDVALEQSETSDDEVEAEVMYEHPDAPKHISVEARNEIQQMREARDDLHEFDRLLEKGRLSHGDVPELISGTRELLWKILIKAGGRGLTVNAATVYLARELNSRHKDVTNDLERIVDLTLHLDKRHFAWTTQEEDDELAKQAEVLPSSVSTQGTQRHWHALTGPGRDFTTERYKALCRTRVTHAPQTICDGMIRDANSRNVTIVIKRWSGAVSSDALQAAAEAIERDVYAFFRCFNESDTMPVRRTAKTRAMRRLWLAMLLPNTRATLSLVDMCRQIAIVRDTLEDLNDAPMGSYTGANPPLVTFLQSGPDGGTVNNDSWHELVEAYPRIKFRLVVCSSVERTMTSDPRSMFVDALFQWGIKRCFHAPYLGVLSGWRTVPHITWSFYDVAMLARLYPKTSVLSPATMVGDFSEGGWCHALSAAAKDILLAHERFIYALDAQSNYRYDTTMAARLLGDRSVQEGTSTRVRLQCRLGKTLSLKFCKGNSRNDTDMSECAKVEDRLSMMSLSRHCVWCKNDTTQTFWRPSKYVPMTFRTAPEAKWCCDRPDCVYKEDLIDRRLRRPHPPTTRMIHRDDQAWFATAAQEISKFNVVPVALPDDSRWNDIDLTQLSKARKSRCQVQPRVVKGVPAFVDLILHDEDGTFLKPRSEWIPTKTKERAVRNDITIVAAALAQHGYEDQVARHGIATAIKEHAELHNAEDTTDKGQSGNLGLKDSAPALIPAKRDLRPRGTKKAAAAAVDDRETTPVEGSRNVTDFPEPKSTVKKTASGKKIYGQRTVHFPNFHGETLPTQDWHAEVDRLRSTQALGVSDIVQALSKYQLDRDQVTRYLGSANRAQPRFWSAEEQSILDNYREKSAAEISYEIYTRSTYSVTGRLRLPEARPQEQKSRKRKRARTEESSASGDEVDEPGVDDGDDSDGEEIRVATK